MEQESSVAAQVFEKKRIPIDERYAAEMEAFEDWKQEGRQKLVQDFAEELSRFEEAMRTLSERREKELAQLGKEYQAVLRASQFYSQTVAILKEILKEHYRQAYTPLKGKLVYLDLAQFDLAHSTLETEDRSRDGGYIRSGISYRIPENARYVRFFVYWNDNHRVDVDLHCGGKTIDNEDLHVGWNADFRNSGVLFSGDITHSDAAEYIDIDLSAPVREIYANVHLFSGRNTFKGIETCYVGLMAVDEIGEKVKFYDPANCFFTHALTQKTRNLFYGYIDVQNRFVRFVGQPNQTNWAWADRPAIESAEGMFSMKDYLDCVLDTQEVCVVDTLEEAELVLTMGKSLSENAVSLVDHNFFLEC